MYLITASDPDVPTDHDRLNLRCSANVLSGVVLSELRFKAVMRSLVHYSMTLYSRHSVSVLEDL